MFSGAVFEIQKPIFTHPDDFKVIFTAITPPGSPATINQGNTPFKETAIQMRHIIIEPCGVLAAHIHPRGSEWGYVIQGAIEFSMFLENSSFVSVTFNTGEGIVVPQGSVHFARNAVCTTSEVVVIFDHPDPAVVYVGEALSRMPSDYLDSAFSSAFPAKTTGNSFRESTCQC